MIGRNKFTNLLVKSRLKVVLWDKPFSAIVKATSAFEPFPKSYVAIKYSESIK